MLGILLKHETASGSGISWAIIEAYILQCTSVRPILRIGEYSLVALQHRRIRYIGLRVSADVE